MQGEANASALRIAFDPGWDGLAKTVTWWNARGENEVKRILTADQLENIAESGRLYLTPVPAEALTAETASELRRLARLYGRGRDDDEL